jgi:hypothetical protein
MINRRGQMVIFVIIAILLVLGIILLFMFYRTPEALVGDSFDPESFLDSCLRDGLREKTSIMIAQGGFLEPGDYKVYDDTKVTYLCKNVNYYEPCVAQYPLYLTSLKKEIESNMESDVEECFFSLEDELSDRSYAYSGGDFEIDVVLKPGIIEFNVIRDFSFSKEGISRDFDEFRVELRNPLYDLGNVAQTIMSQEARFCFFEYVGYTTLYPRFFITRHDLSDATKIYTIQDRESGAKMHVAVRGCVLPA